MDSGINWTTLVGGALWAVWKIGQSIRVRRNGGDGEVNGKELANGNKHAILATLRSHSDRLFDLEKWKADCERRDILRGLGQAGETE